MLDNPFDFLVVSVDRIDQGLVVPEPPVHGVSLDHEGTRTDPNGDADLQTSRSDARHTEKRRASAASDPAPI